MATMHEAQASSKVEALKRVYSALGQAKRLLSDLDIVPNMRDYHSLESFNAARQIYASRVARIVELQNELTGEARFLQRP
jgi:hypothetical protein